jgi:hypothetical protein
LIWIWKSANNCSRAIHRHFFVPWDLTSTTLLTWIHKVIHFNYILRSDASFKNHYTVEKVEQKMRKPCTFDILLLHYGILFWAQKLK